MDDTKTQACQWKYCESECSWDTQCGNKYQFMNDGPKENDYKFCPGCGKPVTLAGDKQPATVEPEEIKALASATGSASPETEYPKCRHCGSDKGSWFSRTIPMVNFCENCGCPWSETDGVE